MLALRQLLVKSDLSVVFPTALAKGLGVPVSLGIARPSKRGTG